MVGDVFRDRSVVCGDICKGFGRKPSPKFESRSTMLCDFGFNLFVVGWINYYYNFFVVLSRRSNQGGPINFYSSEKFVEGHRFRRNLINGLEIHSDEIDILNGLPNCALYCRKLRHFGSSTY
jgi:hypothetical protein